MNQINVRKQNETIEKWVPKVRSILKSKTRRFTKGKNVPFVIRGNQREGKLSKSIFTKTGKDYGEIEFISFQFERHGVFVHKGVSGSHPLSDPREKKEWFNPTLDKYIPELANKIAEINADAAINAAIVKIR